MSHERSASSNLSNYSPFSLSFLPCRARITLTPYFWSGYDTESPHWNEGARGLHGARVRREGSVRPWHEPAGSAASSPTPGVGLASSISALILHSRVALGQAVGRTVRSHVWCLSSSELPLTSAPRQLSPLCPAVPRLTLLTGLARWPRTYLLAGDVFPHHRHAWRWQEGGWPAWLSLRLLLMSGDWEAVPHRKVTPLVALPALANA